MKRKMSWALLAGGIALTASTVAAAPAAAATSGSETFKGTIVTSGVSGTRTVITSVVIAKGAFSGVGRIVEVPNLPTDPDNVSRDDLVFASGSMHLVSTNLDFSVSVNPLSCVATATIHPPGKSSAAPGSSPMRPAAAPAPLPDRRSWPATPTAAAISSTFRSTRWTCSHPPARCRSDDARRGTAAPWSSSSPSDLRITSVFPCVGRRFKACAGLMFTSCCWWRSLAVDGGSGTSRGHARNA